MSTGRFGKSCQAAVLRKLFSDCSRCSGVEYCPPPLVGKKTMRASSAPPASSRMRWKTVEFCCRLPPAMTRLPGPCSPLDHWSSASSGGKPPSPELRRTQSTGLR